MLRLILHEIKIRITQDEPFCAGCFEVDLDACMCALPFAVQYDTVTELAMVHTLTEPYAKFRSSTRCTRCTT
jgi:hypothetical protein